jgi:hypothetical protein
MSRIVIIEIKGANVDNVYSFNNDELAILASYQFNLDRKGFKVTDVRATLKEIGDDISRLHNIEVSK